MTVQCISQKGFIHGSEPAVVLPRSALKDEQIDVELLKEAMEKRFGKGVHLCIVPFHIRYSHTHGYACSICGKVQSWG